MSKTRCKSKICNFRTIVVPQRYGDKVVVVTYSENIHSSTVDLKVKGTVEDV